MNFVFHFSRTFCLLHCLLCPSEPRARMKEKKWNWFETKLKLNHFNIRCFIAYFTANHNWSSRFALKILNPHASFVFFFPIFWFAILHSVLKCNCVSIIHLMKIIFILDMMPCVFVLAAASKCQCNFVGFYFCEQTLHCTGRQAGRQASKQIR